MCGESWWNCVMCREIWWICVMCGESWCNCVMCGADLVELCDVWVRFGRIV